MSVDFDTYEQLFTSLKVDPCKLLGVDRESLTTRSVKKQYRKKIKLAHPDKGAQSDAACKLLNAAYAYLLELASMKDGADFHEERSSLADDMPGMDELDLKRANRPPPVVVEGPTTVTKWVPPVAQPPSTNLDYAGVRQSGGILLVTDSRGAPRLGSSLQAIINEPIIAGPGSNFDEVPVTRAEVVARQRQRAAAQPMTPVLSFKESCAALDRNRGLAMERETLANRRFIQDRAALLSQRERTGVLAALDKPSRRLLS